MSMKHRKTKKEVSPKAINKSHEVLPKKQKLKKLSKEELDRIRPKFKNMMDEHYLKKAQYEGRYGHVNQQVTTEFQDGRIVAVGNMIHFGKTWKTFPDFLLYYLITKMTPEWGKAEIDKPEDKRHQIIKLHQQLCLWQARQKKGDDVIYKTLHTGVTAAYYQLAYDLYALNHHMALQEEVIRRLKIRDNYQGARYELTIAASFIRAGFNIDYEDESDNSKKHPEFIATHIATGEQIAVEAKSRHREGILGQPGNPQDQKKVKADIKRILHEALQKPTILPYVICIDLNMPPIKGNIFDSPTMKEIARTIDNKEKKHKDPSGFPATMYVFTNYPHHYVNDNELDPSKLWIATLVKHPEHPFRHFDTVKLIDESFAQYGNIPNEFKTDN